MARRDSNKPTEQRGLLDTPELLEDPPMLAGVASPRLWSDPDDYEGSPNRFRRDGETGRSASRRYRGDD